MNKKKNKNHRLSNYLWMLLCIVLAGVAFGLYVTYSKIDSTLVYQQKQRFLQKNVDNILAKILGKGNYIVNISLKYSEVKREIYKTNYFPKKIREKYFREANEKLTDNILEQISETKDNAHFLTDDNRNNSNLKIIPGLVATDEQGYEKELPGFPSIPPGNVVAPDDNEEELATNVIQSPIKEITKAFSKGKSFYENEAIEKQVLNKNKEILIIPDSKVERLNLTLVLNKGRLDELGLSHDSVSDIVKTVSGFSNERGDKFTLAIYEFKGLLHTFKKYLSIAIQFVKNFKWFFIMLICVPIMVFLFFLMVNLINKLRHERLKKQVIIREEKEKQQKEQEQSEIDNKKDEIVNFAKNKPDEFARAIVDWIEKEELKS